MMSLSFGCLALCLGKFLGGFSLLLSRPFLVLHGRLPGLFGTVRSAKDLRLSRGQPRDTQQDKRERWNSFHSAPETQPSAAQERRTVSAPA